jgi:hypothetical protein
MKTRSDRQIKTERELRKARSRNPRSVEVHIGQLVLHGFSHSDRRPIAESIERELRALLTQEEFSNPIALEVDRINAGSFQLENKRRSESAGANIARAIYGGLRQ